MKLNKLWHQLGLLFFNYHNDARSNIHKIYARHIYPSCCHRLYMNNIDAPRLHSITSLSLPFLHSYFPSCTPIFLPFLLSLPLFLFFIYSRFFFLFPFSFLFSFLHFLPPFSLSSSILFLFVYYLFSPFSIHHCFIVPVSDCREKSQNCEVLATNCAQLAYSLPAIWHSIVYSDM